MKRIQLFVSIVLLTLASLASAQVRQSTLFIDNGSGKFATITAAALTVPRAFTFPDAAGEMTIQGNAFNGASQLVQLTGGGAYPALSGAAITSLNGSEVASGLVPLAYGGTHTNLNASGGAGQVLKQLTVGGDITVATLASGDIPNNAANTSGSAATLTTSRNIWGQPFNGSAAVTGALSGATSIDATGDITTSTGMLITGNAGNAGTVRIFGAGVPIDLTNDGGSTLDAPNIETPGTLSANTIEHFSGTTIAINPGAGNAITTDGNISVTGGTITASGAITSGATSAAGSLVVFRGDGDASHKVTLDASTVTGTRAVVLPNANGTLALSGSGATLQANATDQDAILSGTSEQYGMGTTITPAASGNIMVIVSGNVSFSAGLCRALIQISYGTGPAPAVDAALTGTAVGNVITAAALGVNEYLPFSANAIITGLTPGVTYWLDLQVQAPDPADVLVSGVGISAIEMP